MKHNDIEEIIDLIKVEPSDKPNYQGALDRLKSIDLAYISKVLNPEQLENVSDYSIFDYPRLEMMSDIETLQKLIDTSNKRKIAKEMFEELGFISILPDSYNTIRYERHDDFSNDDVVVVFEKDTKNVSIFYQYDSNIPVSIDMKLLKAINQQCKELGW